MAVLGPLAGRLSTAVAAYQRTHPELSVTNAWLAERLAERGVKLTPAYIAHLRSGERDNPTINVIVALAGILEVPVTTLVAGEELTADELARTITAAVPQARAVLNRLLGVSDASIEFLIAILDHVRQLERLPRITDGR